MTQNQPLPSAWVEKIFARMQGVYGREFTGQFSTGIVNGIDAGLENAKIVWADELAGFAKWPEAIGYALEHLPERVPNCIKFKELCRNAPRPEPMKLEHKLTEEQMAANKKRIKEIIDGLSNHMATKGESK